jgi:hypothetical protein
MKCRPLNLLTLASVPGETRAAPGRKRFRGARTPDAEEAPGAVVGIGRGGDQGDPHTSAAIATADATAVTSPISPNRLLPRPIPTTHAAATAAAST